MRDIQGEMVCCRPQTVEAAGEAVGWRLGGGGALPWFE